MTATLEPRFNAASWASLISLLSRSRHVVGVGADVELGEVRWSPADVVGVLVRDPEKVDGGPMKVGPEPVDEVVMSLNAHLPLFCRVNSGGGRASGGLGSLHGPRLFVGPGAFRDGVSSVKEVAFKNRAVLPPSTEVAHGRDRRFVPLVTDR